MGLDHKIQEAITAGERNKEAMELIRNWCSHARVEKFGGIGIVEAQTGLPIGHHSMACDFASAPGMAMSDLAEAALDFHDRNCIGCPHRVPVGLPNLAKLVGERDDARARHAAEQLARQQAQASEHALRRQRRAHLRARLPALAASIIDLVDELDGPTPNDAATKLSATVKLAADTFDPLVIEYFFELLEHRERWFDEVGLQLLEHLNVNSSRLTRCAMLVLGNSWSEGTAAKIVETHAALVDEAQVAAAVPALIEHANPRHYPMQTRRVCIPGPLFALYRAQPIATECAIAALLDQYEPHFVSVGARGLESLAERDSSLPSRFIRSLLAKLVRSKRLMRPEPSELRTDGVLDDLQRALALAFHFNPVETDVLAMQFAAGAAGEEEVLIYKVYELILRGRRRDSTQLLPDAADRIAIRRLLTVATQSSSYDVLQEIHGAFTYIAEELVPLAREELSNILGAAIMLTDRIDGGTLTPVLENNPLSELERSNVRDQRINVQRALIDWASAAASGDQTATVQYLEVLDKIRVEHEVLRADLVRQLHKLMRSPVGVNAVLPTLYSAMFGTVVRVRAAAAEALGNLDDRARDDMPGLVYEALVAQLRDSYVMVHKTALETLTRSELSGALNRDAQAAVVTLINAYARNRDDDRFLLECICLYADRYTTEAERAGQLGDILVRLVDEMKPDVVSKELRRLRRQFGQKPRFADIVLRVFEESRALGYREDDLLATLNALPEQEIYRNRERLEALGSRTNVSRSLPRKLVETLTRVGAWHEAARLTETLYTRIPSTTQMRVRRLAANQYRLAAHYEAAIASNRMDFLPGLAQEWKATEAEIERDRVKHERRRRPFPDLPGAH
jgi:hypothetical protein